MHIYTMRMLGYPPGWLEEAQSQKAASHVRMFDKHGQGKSADNFNGVYPWR
jgi:hypothetical protein